MRQREGGGAYSLGGFIEELSELALLLLLDAEPRHDGAVCEEHSGDNELEHEDKGHEDDVECEEQSVVVLCSRAAQQACQQDDGAQQLQSVPP
eukprot:2345246-Rhodomonas_salina.2